VSFFRKFFKREATSVVVWKKGFERQKGKKNRKGNIYPDSV